MPTRDSSPIPPPSTPSLSDPNSNPFKLQREQAKSWKKGSNAGKGQKAAAKRKAAVKKKKEAAAKRKAAVKKKKDVAKRSETTEKKRKRDSGLDGGSSSNPTKRARNRVRETAASPLEHQGVHSPTPAAELPSQGNSKGTPRPVIPSQPQKSPTPTHAASEAENPQQPRVTSGSSTKSPSHRVDKQDGEEIGSNNRDSNALEVAVDNDAPRTVERDDMTVEADKPAGFFFKRSNYGKDETILARRLKELEQDKIQRESWSFQFGEAETGYASGGRRRDKDGDEEAEMHGDKEGDEEAEKQGLDDYEADKEGEDNGDKDGDEADADKDGDEAKSENDGETQIEAEAEKDGEKDVEKQIEAEGEKLMQDTEERFDDDGD
uniref:Uncharacterized protein n=1 Tax=Brassica campestris TaxID=3711 RepID=M4DBY6_BRACM